MTRRLVLCLALAACAATPEPGERSYLCDGGRLAQVSFVGETARVRVGGESFDLWRKSGTRYAGARAALQTKDDEALLAIDGRELGPCQEVKPQP